MSVRTAFSHTKKYLWEQRSHAFPLHYTPVYEGVIVAEKYNEDISDCIGLIDVAMATEFSPK